MRQVYRNAQASRLGLYRYTVEPFSLDQTATALSALDAYLATESSAHLTLVQQDETIELIVVC